MALLATLNTGTPTATLVGTAGASYIIGATGTFDSTVLTLEASLATTPTEYGPIEDGRFFGPFFSGIILPSTNLRCSISTPGGISSSTSVKVELQLIA